VLNDPPPEVKIAKAVRLELHEGRRDQKHRKPADEGNRSCRRNVPRRDGPRSGTLVGARLGLAATSDGLDVAHDQEADDTPTKRETAHPDIRSE